jgi:putative acetyltransferase
MSGEIISYDPKYKQAFYDINMEWLAANFTVEPQHTAMLSNPKEELLAKGGDVFFAIENGVAVGAVGLKNHGAGVYELTKLGVSPRAQGGGYGRRLCEAVIASFQKKGGTRLFLETHSMLEAAMAIYVKLGFKIGTNPDGETYLCTNSYMEWQNNNA